MNPVLKSRDYHRAYQKWDKLLIDGKADEITIIPGANSKLFFSLVMKKTPQQNNAKILQALEQFPAQELPLKNIREDYEGGPRL